MIVDTSALVAIFADEAEREPFLEALGEAERNVVSSASWVEFGTVLVRRFGVQAPEVVQANLAHALLLSIEPVTAEQAAAAVRGYAVYGRGSRHRADLNFGDCFAYALAHASGEPLLFKGDDFNHTDLRLAAAASFPR